MTTPYDDEYDEYDDYDDEETDVLDGPDYVDGRPIIDVEGF